MQTVEILDIKINKINVAQLLEKIAESIKERKKLKIFYLNVHAFNIAFKDALFKKVINDADLVFCDGVGVKIGAKILGISIGQRMTPPDWIDNLCETLIQQNYSMYLLGDEIGVAEKCAAVLIERHPGLNIKGTHHGFFKKEGVENAEIIRSINEAKSNVLLVGFGMPLQEKWISSNIENIDANIFLSVGAMFRWIAQVEKRAPLILASNGFEGVWRLITQPKKVWRRYILEVPYFFYKIIHAATFNRKY